METNGLSMISDRLVNQLGAELLTGLFTPRGNRLGNLPSGVGHFEPSAHEKHRLMGIPGPLH